MTFKIHRIAVERGGGSWAILTSLRCFHLSQKHLDISLTITAESLPRTGNLWFLSASYYHYVSWWWISVYQVWPNTANNEHPSYPPLRPTDKNFWLWPRQRPIYPIFEITHFLIPVIWYNFIKISWKYLGTRICDPYCLILLSK